MRPEFWTQKRDQSEALAPQREKEEKLAMYKRNQQF